MAKKGGNKRVDVKDPIALSRLEAANRRTAAQETQRFAQERAGAIQGLSRAAIGGGQIADMSYAPGFQNPEVGRYTGMMMRGLTRPATSAARSALAELRLMRQPWYKKAQKDVAGSPYAGYAYGGGSTENQATSSPYIL